MPVADAPITDLVLERTRSQRLSDAYAPCFALILQLRASRDFGDASVLRPRVEKLLDAAEKEARRNGYPEEDVEAATFALVAFIDETILSSDWRGKDQWLVRPLQLQRYDRFDAGEYFFERLAQLRAAPTAHGEALEVYYLCVALGFKGQYMLHDQERLRLLIEETHAELSRLPSLRAERLAPHGTPRDQKASEARGRVPAWIIFAAAVGIALVIYLGMFLYISGAANETAAFIDRLPRADQVQ